MRWRQRDSVAVPHRVEGSSRRHAQSPRALETRAMFGQLEEVWIVEQSSRDPRDPMDPIDPDPAPKEDIGPSAEAVVAELRADITAIHRDSYGRGAEDIKVYLLDDVLIVILEGLELLPNEEFMIE